jgi:hypothetical protein
VNLGRPLLAAAVAACVGLAAAAAHAGDRPFKALATAAAEEDDDRVWSVETTFDRLGSVQSAAVQAEYAFDPVDSVQLGYVHARERRARLDTQALELEGKHLFNHIARDGWGWGVVLSHAFTKAPDEGWRGGNWQLALPLSLQLGASSALVHATLGWEKSRAERSERLLALGAEAEVGKRARLFAEVARAGEVTLANLGLRHWVQRERLALDFSLQRARGGIARDSGVVVGLSWYDL